MYDVYTTENKIPATTKVSTMETTSFKLPTVSITGRIGKFGQHLYIIQTTYIHSDSITKERTFFQWHVTSKLTHQKKPLTFLGDALTWLTRTAVTKDVRNIKGRVNQVIETQIQRWDTLVHVISVLNFTRYTTQVNRQHINAIMEADQRTQNDVTRLLDITIFIYTCTNYQQIPLQIHSILANLRDSLYYMKQIAMDYIDATTISILSPYVLPVDDLREMLMHIESEWPSTMH